MTTIHYYLTLAFEKPHEEPDWSLVYPELGYMKDPDEKTSSNSPVQQLDNMLDKANVDQALIMRLGLMSAIV